ncbi:MAG TPA: c-type cytochrome [Nocardioidaceae bacterium]|nr:c-type cytochrome [Nocardioidaceae bacterium]
MVLLLGLLLTGGVYAAFSPASASTPSAANQDLIAKGRQLFLVGCASCHGQHGEGIVTSATTEYGPPLIGVGAAAVDFQVGTGRMPLARPGMQAPEKKQLYTPDEIRALAAYVASLGPGPAIPAKAKYDTSDAGNHEVVRGGQLFLTNCTACHNFAASGGALPHGRYAPALAGVTKKHIYEALITGPQQMPVFSDNVLKPQQKRDIIAYLKSIESEPSYGGSKLGYLGPVSEGLFGWLVGIGLCVGFAVWIASHSVRSSKKGAKS